MSGLETRLADVPLLAGLDAKTVARLAKHGTRRRYAAGTYIFHEGDPAAALYIVLSGRVAVEELIGDEAHEITQLGPNDFFGEMALIENVPRSASARAVVDTECILLVSWEFTALVREYPDVAEVLLKQLIRRAVHHQHVVC